MSYKYAILSEDGSAVIEYRTYPEPLDLDTCKRLADGSMKVRPVVESVFPVEANQRSVEVVTIEADRVVISNRAEALPLAELNAAHNKRINDQIAGIESTITQRRIREAVLDPVAQVWLAERNAEIADLRAARL